MIKHKRTRQILSSLTFSAMLSAVILISNAETLSAAAEAPLSEAIGDTEDQNSESDNKIYALTAPSAFTVWVDSSSGLDIVLLDADGNEVELDAKTQRIIAEIDTSVARADPEDSTIWLTGVQSGSTKMNVYLQELNEQGEFENVLADRSSSEKSLELYAAQKDKEDRSKEADESEVETELESETDSVVSSSKETEALSDDSDASVPVMLTVAVTAK